MTACFMIELSQTYPRRETINRGAGGRTGIARRQLRAHEFVRARTILRPTEPTHVRQKHAQQPQPRLSSQIPYGEYREALFPPALTANTKEHKTFDAQ